MVSWNVKQSLSLSICRRFAILFSFVFWHAVRDIAQRNLATLRCVELDIPAFESTANPHFNPELTKPLMSLIETLKGRDKYIQNLMMVIDDRLEKVWKLPLVLGGIIHGYLWDREDLLNITSKVKLLLFGTNHKPHQESVTSHHCDLAWA